MPIMLTNKELNKIETICKKLRQKIIEGEIKFICSDDFPIGCCGNVSQDYLLPQLLDAGFKTTKYISNRVNKKGKSHAWLEYKGYIIDITADQFPQIIEPILIIKKEESKFHKQFK